MFVQPLCIIQARQYSKRLPGKMLLELHGETLIARAVRLAGEAFGAGNVVVAIPQGDIGTPLHAHLQKMHVAAVPVPVPENDVLARFWYVAHLFRWHPDSVIVRWTPDDPFKEPKLCKRVALGERLPVELGAEAFTLAMLDAAYERTALRNREHITHALFPTLPPPAPTDRQLTVDTPEDWARVLAENP